MNDNDLKQMAARFITNNATLFELAKSDKLSTEVDTTCDRESIIRFHVRHTCARLEIVRDHDKRTTQYHVEKPLDGDGHFATFKTSCSDTAIRVLMFTVAILNDIQTQIERVG